MVAAAGIEQGLITHGAFSGNLVGPIARHCKWVRISIDTYDRNAYSRKRETRTTSFDLVIKNAAALAESGLTVGLNMNVAAWNNEHIEDLFELACKLKVSYLIILLNI
jgi:molybdenum cofactor biosynthesis enzyme MoaA